jgi:predicted nucleic acid-binding protein
VTTTIALACLGLSADGQIHGDMARHRHRHGHVSFMARKVSIAEARDHFDRRRPRRRTGRRTELERFMTEVVAGVRVLPYGERAARWHALERARLTAAGRPPPFLDSQIAAVAAVNDPTVVSGNAAHFEPFEGLRVENWLA